MRQHRVYVMPASTSVTPCGHLPVISPHLPSSLLYILLPLCTNPAVVPVETIQSSELGLKRLPDLLVPRYPYAQTTWVTSSHLQNPDLHHDIDSFHAGQH